MLKKGILGGTFNPIHSGHLCLANAARNEAMLDQILFIPSGISYMKNTDSILPAFDRVKMVELAIQNISYFQISRMEVEKSGNSYSYETIEALKKQEPDTSFYFIVGADTLFSMEKWKCPERIFKNAVILAACRNDASFDKIRKQSFYLADCYHANIQLLTMDKIDISSSRIRDNLANNNSVDGMLPKAVEEYILTNHLYQKTKQVTIE